MRIKFFLFWALTFLICILYVIFKIKYSWETIQKNYIQDEAIWIGPELKIEKNFPFKVDFKYSIKTFKGEFSNTNIFISLDKTLFFGGTIDTSLYNFPESYNVYTRLIYQLKGDLCFNNITGKYKLINPVIFLKQKYYQKEKNSDLKHYVRVPNLKNNDYIMMKTSNNKSTGGFFSFYKENPDNATLAFWAKIKYQRKFFSYKQDTYFVTFYKPRLNFDDLINKKIALQLMYSIFTPYNNTNTNRKNEEFVSFQVVPFYSL